MGTQPIRGQWLTLSPTVISRILLAIAGAFVLLGAVSLYGAAPAASLTPLHLIALVCGWSVSWGSSVVVLQKSRPEADPFILPTVALLTGWGLLIIARLAPGFLLRQILWLAIGCTALCGIALMPTMSRLLRRYRYSLLAGGLLLLGATLFFGVNPSGFGQQLWLGAFGIYFQPSELLKLLLVIYLASYLSDRRDVLVRDSSGRPHWLAVIGPMLTMVGMALLFLGWQQDLGGALLFYLTFVAMLYLAWGKGWHVVLSLVLFVPVGIAGYVLSSRVALRVSIWLDPWAPEQADRAFQILQSLFALADGGLAGQGLGQGLPTLIPAVHTDFVYAALVEEFGLTGAIALLTLLGLLVYRGLILAQKADATFESLLAGGISALLAIQTWVIVGGNAKLIPLTGVTLPYLSYGGSSLLMTLIATGLLINLSTPHPEPLTLTLPAVNEYLSLRQTVGRLGRALLVLLVTIALATGVWSVLRAGELRAYATNPRRILAESRIQRGRILDRDGVVLADIQVDAAGYVTRTYPIPETAPVVGYTTLQYGAEGIESTCDARLRGDTGRTPWQSVQAGLLHETAAGRDVRLTLDTGLQQTAQHLLDGHTGAAVLVDTRTGDVLVLASAPTYDPATVETNWGDLRDDADAPLLNRATRGLAQPGSVLQTVILGTILEDGGLPPLEQLAGTPVGLNGELLTCAQTPVDNTWPAAIAAACPAPFAALGNQLDVAQVAKAFTAWGLTDAPVFDIPAIAAPWQPTGSDITREIVGQGDLLVTPLQMANVAATLGNDGRRITLKLLAAPQPGCAASESTGGNQVVRSDVAQSILDLWPRYGDAAGHSGEALAGPERTQSWFIGLNSPDVPRYAVAVLVENPQQRQLAAQIGLQLLEQASAR